MTSLTYPFQSAPTPGTEVIDVAPGVKWLRMPLPLALDHINLYLVEDDDGWIIIDTGIANDATRTLWQQLLAGPLAGLSISGVLCTHHHFDHAGLAGWLVERLRVPFYMSYGEYYTLRVLASQTQRAEALPWAHQQFFHRAGIPETSFAAIHVMLCEAGQLVSTPPAAFRRLRHGETLTLAGRRWQLHLGEGHVTEHMLLHCAENGVLLAGDQLLPRITSNVSVLPTEPEADLLNGWFDTLERLGQLPADTLVLPAHELPYRGLQTRARQLRAHHEQQFATLLELCQGAPLTAHEAAQQLFARRALTRPMEEMMAVGECLAHLTWLARRGQMSVQPDAQGQLRYQTRSAPA